MYYPDMIVLGDMNLFFEQPEVQRAAITKTLKALNGSEKLRAASRAELYLPFLDPHPGRSEVFRSNARQDQTFDQIAFVTNTRRLPTSADKASAGTKPGAFDYGVFNYLDLFAQALHKKAATALTPTQRNDLYSRFQFDVSDHMPIWVHLPLK